MASACADDSDICAEVGEVIGSVRTTEDACFFTRAFFCGGVPGGGGSSVAGICSVPSTGVSVRVDAASFRLCDGFFFNGFGVASPGSKRSGRFAEVAS